MKPDEVLLSLLFGLLAGSLSRLMLSVLNSGGFGWLGELFDEAEGVV